MVGDDHHDAEDEPDGAGGRAATMNATEMLRGIAIRLHRTEKQSEDVPVMSMCNPGGTTEAATNHLMALAGPDSINKAAIIPWQKEY